MSLRKVLRSVAAVAAAVGSLAAVAPAGAAVVIASFDPLVGAPFPADVSYRGTATFTIPDACLAGSGTLFNGTETLFPASPCIASNAPILITAAEVTFFNGTGDLATLFYGSGDITVLRAEISEGEVVGLFTDYANPPQELSQPGLFNGTVALRFVTGDGPSSPGGAELRLEFDNETRTSNRATTITFARVPEPATLALVGLAAFGAAAASRRKKV